MYFVPIFSARLDDRRGGVSFMADAIEDARSAAIRSIARDLRVDGEEAQRWGDAWERFAVRHSVVPGSYFWDSARGWIDAQRSFKEAHLASERPPAPISRAPHEPPVAAARKADQGR